MKAVALSTIEVPQKKLEEKYECYLCGKETEEVCEDCGQPVCSEHSRSCEYCGRKICLNCDY